MIETLVFETTYNMSTGDPKGIIDNVYYYDVNSELQFDGPGDPFDGNYPDVIKIRVFDDHEFQLHRVSEDKLPPDVPTGTLAWYTESGSISPDVLEAMLSIAPSIAADQHIEFFVDVPTFEDYPADATDVPIALYVVIDQMKKLSRNYNDKNAIAVKNPIADALDRLNTAVKAVNGPAYQTANVVFHQNTDTEEHRITVSIVGHLVESDYTDEIVSTDEIAISTSEAVEDPVTRKVVKNTYIECGPTGLAIDVNRSTGDFTTLQSGSCVVHGDCELYFRTLV